MASERLWNTLVSGLAAKGGGVPGHPDNPRCKPDVFPATGRGLAAPLGAEMGQELLTVPMEATMQEQTEHRKVSWFVDLAGRLLTGESGSYAELALEGKPSSLAGDPERALARVHYSPAKRAIEEVWSEMAVSRGEPDLADACLAVLSRTLRVAGKRTLIPAIDLINHSDFPNARIVASKRGGSISAVASRDIRRGEEITISYGSSRGTCDFAVYYGFLPDAAKEVDAVCLDEGDGDLPGAAAVGGHPAAPMQAVDGGRRAWIRAPLRMHRDEMVRGEREEGALMVGERLARRDGLVDERLLKDFSHRGLQHLCEQSLALLAPPGKGSATTEAERLASEFMREKERTLEHLIGNFKALSSSP